VARVQAFLKAIVENDLELDAPVVRASANLLEATLHELSATDDRLDLIAETLGHGTLLNHRAEQEARLEVLSSQDFHGVLVAKQRCETVHFLSEFLTSLLTSFQKDTRSISNKIA
jgi:hypothetical protein